jgi:hypothetical protein
MMSGLAESNKSDSSCTLDFKPLIIGNYYRPPNRTDNEYVNNSINELFELCTGSNNATVWISGDFNLGDISWSSGNITIFVDDIVYTLFLVDSRCSLYFSVNHACV